MHQTVMVTGASGVLGSVLVESLLREGKRVRVLTRHPIEGTRFSLPVESIVGDIADPNVAKRMAAGVDVVFHLAALLHISSPQSRLRPEYQRVNVEGTRNVVEAANEAGARRIVLFSTVAVYGRTSGENVDEMTPPQPDSFYAETKLRAEEIALAARRDSGEPLSCVLRLAAVYGSRMKGNYQRLARAVARGWFVPIGDGSNRRTLIYEHDAAAAAILAAEHPNAPGQIFNVTDGEVHVLKDVLGAICAGLNRRPPTWHVPLSVAQFGAKFADSLLPLAGRKNNAMQTMVSKYVEDVAVSGARFQRELGFQPRYSLQSGWQQTLAEMKSSGQL